jgi:hypothetical protein
LISVDTVCVDTVLCIPRFIAANTKLLQWF